LCLRVLRDTYSTQVTLCCIPLRVTSTTSPAS
jgi:hypothetical protein